MTGFPQKPPLHNGLANQLWKAWLRENLEQINEYLWKKAGNE